MNRVYENLLRLRDLTEEVNGLLYQEDMQCILQKLTNRQKLLDDLQESWRNSDIKSEDHQDEIEFKTKDIKILFKSIMAMDKKNMEVVNSKLNNLSESLTKIAKEKQTIRDIRAISKRKQIVDFLY